MLVEPRQVEFYQTEGGDFPYESWFDGLKDIKTRQRITNRVLQLATGNLGECTHVGGGVLKLILPFGPGYRIYVGQVGTTGPVIVLGGGSVSTESVDISTAKKHWEDFQIDQRKEIEGAKCHEELKVSKTT